MLNIVDLKKEQKKLPLLRLAFRPFFLFGSIFSVIALLAWGLFLTGSIDSLQPYGGWLWWHGHEMLFGFVAAIIAGFLLTAVQNWSGIPGLSGWPLAALFAVWAIARLLMLFPVLPATFIMFIDIAFLPLAAIALARPIFQAKIWNNLIFVVLLMVLAFINILSHYQQQLGSISSLPAGQAAILLISIIMVVMGGRVIPFFTANATQTSKPQPMRALEVIAIGSLILALIYSIWASSLAPNSVAGSLYLVAFVSHLVRFHRWQWQLTFNNPLLWSLHSAYLFIVCSFALLAGYHFGYAIPLTTALHGLTVGGMGLLILAMIARVSLGHSGRPLKVGRWITVGFFALIVAAIARTSATFATDQMMTLYWVSIAGWGLGYVAFTAIYWPILTSPRADGRPG